MDGNPAAPQPWRPADWDVTVHSRDTQTFTALEPMAAHHGTDCSAPPATHQTNTYEGAVYLCRDHVMTAINAGGYGLIYLTPPALADWSAGESIVRWDMSTLRTSPRDWVDLWVMPFDDDLQLALDEWLPDGNGLPRRALHVKMDNGDQGSIFRVALLEDFKEVGAYEFYQGGLEGELAKRGLTSSASRRDTFELHLRQGHVTFTMPQYGITFADAAVPGLTWTRGVVTLGHHSYNPTKDCTPSGTMPCLADTWHFDNVSVTPAIPFSIVRAERRYADASHSTPFTLAAPAPQHAVLRFSGIGNALGVSFDGGVTWQTPQAQPGSKPAPMGTEHFQSYRMAIPAGTTRLAVRGQPWFAGDWQVKDLSVWAPGTGAGASASSTPTRTPIATATLPTTATVASTSTHTPIPAPSPSITALASTATPTSTPLAPTPTVTLTPPPSTPTAWSTPTSTTTPTLTATLAPSVPTGTSTPTAASSPTPGGISTPTPTATPLSTPAANPTSSATPMAPTPSPTPLPPVATVVCRIEPGFLICPLSALPT